MQEILPLLNLSFSELSALCSTNSEFRELCEDDRIWENLYLRDYGSLNYQPVSWKLEYLIRKNETRMAAFSEVGVRNISFPLGQKVESVSGVGDYLLVLTDRKELYVKNLSNDQPLKRFGNYHYQGLGGHYAILSNHEAISFKDDGGLRSKTLTFPEAKQIFLAGPKLVSVDALNTFRVHKHYRAFRIPPHLKVRKVYLMEWGCYFLSVYDKEQNQTQVYSIHLAPQKNSLNLLNISGIKIVSRDLVVGLDGKLYRYSSANKNMVSITDHWIKSDPTWTNRSIKLIQGAHLILESGEVYRLYTVNDPEILPPWTLFPEPIIDASPNVFLGKSGNFYIRGHKIINPFDFQATNVTSGSGFQQWINNHTEHYPVYLFWRNSKPVVISRTLYQTLFEKGEVEKLVNNRATYRNNWLEVSQN